MVGIQEAGCKAVRLGVYLSMNCVCSELKSQTALVRKEGVQDVSVTFIFTHEWESKG